MNPAFRYHQYVLDRIYGLLAPSAAPFTAAAGNPESPSEPQARNLPVREGASVHYIDSGYPVGDPKGPEYHSTHADIWDMRERG